MPSVLPDFGTNMKNGHEERIKTQVEKVTQRKEKPGQRCRLAEWLQMLTNVTTPLQVSPALMLQSMTRSHCCDRPEKQHRRHRKSRLLLVIGEFVDNSRPEPTELEVI